MTDFVIGCTHFGHANIINLANRPFLSVEEMDDTLIENWNLKVSPSDTVYHLGDFSFRGHKTQGEYLSRLNGNIVSIQGNHDPALWGHKIFTLEYKKKKIIMCHYPIEEWDGWWKGSIHLHCHTHKDQFHSAERRGNVTVEAIGYYPMALETAIDMLT